MTEQAEKICPLLSAGTPTLEKCLRERCAWWVDTMSGGNASGNCVAVIMGAAFWLGVVGETCIKFREASP